VLGATACLVLGATSAAAQTGATAANSGRPQIDGQIAVLFDAVPKQDATELRPRLRIDLSGSRGSLRYRADVSVEGLAADRGGSAGAVIAQGRDVWLEWAGAHVELRGGVGRLPWGRLDEIAPTDVINPLDTAKFLLEGRAEARLPVVFLRGRVFASEAVRVEGVLLPVFRRATFDALDEPTSPFNLLRTLVLPAGVVAAPGIEHVEPETSWENLSGGGRVTGTIGRTDLGVAVFRGFDGFGAVTFEPEQPIVGPAIVGRLVERHERFTMIGADVETVRGDWALRGEVAVFVERQVASMSGLGLVPARTIDAGAGFDRRAGAYRVFGSVLVRREWSPEDPLIDRTDVSLVGSIDRSFGRDRWLARAFAVVNAADRAGFVRGLVVWHVRDDVTLEGSGGAFVGTSDDAIGRFRDRDFAFARVAYHF
jgi:hypothetical protein